MAVKGIINFKNNAHRILKLVETPIDENIPATMFGPEEEDERGVPGCGYPYYVFTATSGWAKGERVGVHFTEDSDVEFTFTPNE